MEELELIRRIESHPETYRSILGCYYGKNSLTVIVKRKILRNIHSGNIYRVYLNGSRGGEVLLVSKNNKKNIVVVLKNRDFLYYICDGIEKKEKDYICLIDAEELDECRWIKLGNLEIHESSVVKIV